MRKEMEKGKSGGTKINRYFSNNKSENTLFNEFVSVNFLLV